MYQFSYVDVKLRSKWKRIRINDIPDFCKRHRFFNLFSTIQQYKDATYSPEELQYCGVFFDLDGELEQARIDANKIVNFFVNFGVKQEQIRVWFSGKKGFHITIEPEVLGIKPDRELTYIIKQFALWVSEMLNLTTFDSRVYSIRRMWRIPNTIHRETRLFKIPLYHHEIKSVNDILELAKQSRPELYPVEEYEDITANDDLSTIWNKFVEEYKNLKYLEKLRPKVLIQKGIPVCITDLLDNSIRRVGTRNQAIIVLATYFKDNDIPHEEALRRIIEWSLAIPPQLSTSSESERKANARSVCKTVYENENYHFSCAYIRGLGVGTDNPIKCETINCLIAKEEDQETAEAIEVSLEDSVRNVFVGKKLKVRGIVSGKDYTPYAIPKNVLFECNQRTDKCVTCRLSKSSNCELHLKENSPIMLLMANSSQEQLLGYIKRLSGIPQKCYSARYRVLNYHNLWEIQLIPEIQFTPETMLVDQEYVVRRAYLVGENIRSNREYFFICYPTPDPRSQYVVLLITEALGVESDLANFQIIPELHEELKIFQSGATVMEIDDKLADIYDDLSSNVTKIFERRDMHLAVDLVYHSCLSFWFHDEFIARGWLELMIVGDTGQGKTQLLERLSQHYNYGYIISGETSRRTGLVYSFQQTAQRWFLQWGAIPLNDRKLVVIDEFSELPDEDKEKMSRLRSSGIAEAYGVITAKTPARTRLIFLSNPADRRGINTYNYGVESVTKILRSPEDVRRLDFAVIVASGEIDSEIYTRTRNKIEHKYTASLCANLLRWVWSRDPRKKEVVLEGETIKKIMEVTNQITEEFSSAIPLVEPADMRYKIARLAIALAGRLYSTEDGKNIKVLPAHVEYVGMFLHHIYSKKTCDYLGYSKEIKKKRMIDLSRKDLTVQILKDYFEGEVPQHFIEVFISSKNFRKGDIADQLGWEKEEAKVVFRLLSKNRLIQSTTAGFVKTPLFIEILKELQQEDQK